MWLAFDIDSNKGKKTDTDTHTHGERWSPVTKALLSCTLLNQAANTTQLNVGPFQPASLSDFQKWH